MEWGLHELAWEPVGGKFGFGTRMFAALSPLLEETWQKGKERLRSTALPLRNLCLRLGPFGCALARGTPTMDDPPNFTPNVLGSLWGHRPRPDPALLCQASSCWRLNWLVMDLMTGLSDLTASSLLRRARTGFA